jgi:U2-associated protein SR140
MGWCISRAAASDEIVETLAEALTLAKTPVPKKLARLFLLSDVLHNSCGTAPKASTFRSRSQAHLPSIFGSLRTAYMALESRMALEVMREQVTKVLHVWQAWSLFPPSMTAKLERIFLHGEGAAAAPAPATQSVEEDIEEDIDGEPMTLDDEPGSAPSGAPCWALTGASAAMSAGGSAVKAGAGGLIVALALHLVEGVEEGDGVAVHRARHGV